jgi:hypothetical protein
MRKLLATLALVLALQSTAKTVEDAGKQEYTSAGINGTAAAASAALAAKGYGRPSRSLLLILSARVESPDHRLINRMRDLAAAYSQPSVMKDLLVLLRKKTSPPIQKVLRYGEMRVELDMNHLPITVTVRTRDTGKHWIKMAIEFVKEHVQELFLEKLTAIVEKIEEKDLQQAVAKEVQDEVSNTKQTE